MAKNETQFTLTLEPVAGWSTPPPVRLRKALMSLLRGHGLKCTSLSVGGEKVDDVEPKTDKAVHDMKQPTP